MTSASTENDTILMFLVDDHAVVRAGLSTYLDTEPGMSVPGEASDGKDALNRIAVLANNAELPDVVLVDLLMPVMDASPQQPKSKRQWPIVEVVAVTAFLEEEKIHAALEVGATGYLLKDADAGTSPTPFEPRSPAKCISTPPQPIG